MKAFSLSWRGRSLDLDAKTAIMGVLNVTPDSFSDGGKFFEKDKALVQAERLIKDGADILDVGGESTRPFSEPVSARQEAERVIPVIEQLAGKIPVPISIDTTKASVAARAVEAGADIINDISALRFDPDIGKVAAESGALVVLMHMQGSPQTMQINPVYEDLIGEISDFLSAAADRAISAGVPEDRIIIDPGLGFGKTTEHNLCILNRLEAFCGLGLPVLVGPSRKAFIRKALACREPGRQFAPDDPEIEEGTSAAAVAAVLKGASIIRLHDVAAARTAIRIADALIHETPEFAGRQASGT